MNNKAKNTPKIIVLLILSLGLFLSACDQIEQLTTSEPPACDGAGTMFQDDFSGALDCGWVEYSRGGSITAVSDGVLQMSSSQPGEVWWTNPGRSFSDVIINVNTTQVSGPDDNAYGVICRYQDEGNYYLFLISGDGYYAIGKYQEGEDSVLYLTEDGQFGESDAINQGLASNDIRVSCVGPELSLAVNGVPLATVTDPTFVLGDVGLAVSTFQPGTAVVNFDDLRVTAP